MAKTPFKLRSGNSPLKQNIFRKKGGPTSSSRIKTGLDKFFGSLTKEVEHFGKSVKDVAKTDVPKKLTTDIKNLLTKGKSKGKFTKEKGKVEKPVVKPVVKPTDYSKAKSVNALVAERTKWMKKNPKEKSKNFPGQSEINKRLEENPDKWD